MAESNKSKFRKMYMRRLIVRIIIFIIMILIYIFLPDTFIVAKDFNFIKQFSPLHIIWLIWMIDMVLQLCKVPGYWPLGSQKQFSHRFVSSGKMSKKDIAKEIKESKRDVILIATAWILLVAIISIIYLKGIIPYQVVILISTAFYVCDVICIVGWCPFKVFFMQNKCCTTCRIFNWDHAMMFTPLIVIPGIWTYSLLGLSLIIVLVWEIAYNMHPERFYEKTNSALKCINCKDKICGKKVNE